MASSATWTKELLREGSGEVPKSGDNVEMHYVGTFHGTTKEFDSSRAKNKTFKFQLGKRKVIKGWDECVATMRVGERCKLVCPPEFAYGKRGAGGVIPPDATLDFDMELLSIIKPAAWEKEILQVGTGATPQAGQTMVMHYVGTLVDGTEFDSSRRKNRPFKFKLGAGRVIRGWDLCVATMKIGERCKLICPPEFGYGKSGAGGVIPGGATLHFDMELLGVE